SAMTRLASSGRSLGTPMASSEVASLISCRDSPELDSQYVMRRRSLTIGTSAPCQDGSISLGTLLTYKTSVLLSPCTPRLKVIVPPRPETTLPPLALELPPLVELPLWAVLPGLVDPPPPPPPPPWPDEDPPWAGLGAPRLSRMSPEIRVKSDRASVACSTLSRPAWALRNVNSSAVYNPAMSRTPMALASTTSSSV